MERILPKILAVLTRHPREKVKIKWYGKSWTHNIFRFYEMIFWRRTGIANSGMSAGAYLSKGKVTVTYRIHSFEGFCAFVEQCIREGIGNMIRKWESVRLILPEPVYVNGIRLPNPFLFAIAFDTSNQGNAVNTTFSFTYTVTGSNTAMSASMAGGNANTFTSAKYNNVSLSDVQTTISGSGNTLHASALAGPATGANSFTTTWGSSTDLRTEVSSYTGVKQTGQPSASSTTTNFASQASPFTQSITTVDDNSWIVWAFLVATAVTASTNTTVRQQELVAYGVGIADTNSAQTPAGSKSMTLTYTAGNFVVGGIQMAWSPAAATATAIVTPNLPLIGVG